MSNNISSGFGTGSGNIGTNFQPTPFELETTATKAEVKKELNLTPGLNPDPLLNQNLIKPSQDPYSSPSSQPRLPSPFRTRLAGSDMENQNQDWQSLYNQLEDSLPQDIKAAIQSELMKPFPDRLPSIVSLTNLLTAASKTLLQIENGSHTDPEIAQEGSPLLERTLTNQAMPNLARLSTLNDLSLMNSIIQNHLQGHLNENPYADQMLSVLHYINDSLVALYQSQTPEEMKKGIADNQNWLSYFAESIKSQLEQIPGVVPGRQIVQTSLKTLGLVANSCALETMESAPSFYLSLTAGLVGLSKDESLGNLAQGSSKLAEAASSFLAEGPQLVAYKSLFETAFTSLLVLGSGIASQLGKEGLQPLPKTNLKENIQYSSLLTQSFIAHSQVIKNTFESLAKTLALQDDKASIVGHLYSLLGTVLLAQISSLNDEKNYHANLNAVRNPLQNDLEKIQPFFSEQTATARSFNAFVQQAKTALDQEDYDGFAKTFDQVVSMVGIDPSTLYQELSQISESSRTTLLSAQTDDSTRLLTTIAESA